MLKDAIEKILTLSAPTVVKDKETGMAWSDRKLYEMEPPKITKLNLPDLTALANFLGMEDNDTKGFIQVVSPQKVVHWSDMRDPGISAIAIAKYITGLPTSPSAARSHWKNLLSTSRPFLSRTPTRPQS